MNAGHERIAAAFAGSGKLAALMPYMMAGFPSFDAALEIGRAYARAGADIVELGVPFSDPLADGPVIHAAGTRALAAGSTVDRVLELAAAPGPGYPRRAHVLRQPDSRPRLRALRRGPGRRRDQRADRPRPASGGGAGARGGLRRRRRRARPAGRADDDRRSARGDRGARQRLCLHRLADGDDRRAQGARRRPSPRSSPGPGGTRPSRSPSASASARPTRRSRPRRRAPTG